MRSDNSPPPSRFTDHRDYDRYRGIRSINMLRGEPLELNWAGWRSTTAELQYNGWEFAESRGYAHERMEEYWYLDMRHPQLGISGTGQANRISFSHRRHMSRENGKFGPPVHLHVSLGMPHMVMERRPMELIPVDANPMYQEIRPYDLFHMPYFQPIRQKDTKDIFLEQASVEEIMQIALDKQNPKAMELRAKRMAQRRRDEYREGDNIAARIILAA